MKREVNKAGRHAGRRAGRDAGWCRGRDCLDGWPDGSDGVAGRRREGEEGRDMPACQELGEKGTRYTGRRGCASAAVVARR